MVRDEVMEVHNKSVLDPQMGPFNYPISRSEVIKHTLAQGAQNYTFTLPDTTQIPTQLILGLVKESASAGSKGLNTFNFKHYDIRETVVQFNDQKFEVKTDFTTENVTRAYRRLIRRREYRPQDWTAVSPSRISKSGTPFWLLI